MLRTKQHTFDNLVGMQLAFWPLRTHPLNEHSQSNVALLNAWNSSNEGSMTVGKNVLIHWVLSLNYSSHKFPCIM